MPTVKIHYKEGVDPLGVCGANLQAPLVSYSIEAKNITCHNCKNLLVASAEGKIYRAEQEIFIQRNVIDQVKGSKPSEDSNGADDRQT